MNTFGHIFRITTFGESHGKALGVTIDGCPAGYAIDLAQVQAEMRRRRPGQSKITTPRKERDEIEVLSGIFEGKTTGTPLHILIPNQDARSHDYGHIQDKFRPSHADFTYQKKYGLRDYRGGGRSSARETAARVAAGAIAKQILATKGIHTWAYVSSVGAITLEKPYTELDFSAPENIVRCPDPETASAMIAHIEAVRDEGDTIGGVVSGVIRGLPVGLGEPVFGKLHAELGRGMLSINAVKGFEYGSGFAGTRLRGSDHNDSFEQQADGRVRTRTNHSGGIQGGISNGEDVYFRVAFKPVATLMQDQESINAVGESVTVSGKGRHDPCVVPRAVPIVEAMAALTALDFYLWQQMRQTAT
ncbi:MAG: chorismate synthase [Bernardetiaceae bacterium]